MRILVTASLVALSVSALAAVPAAAQSSGPQLAAAQRAAWGRPGSTTLRIDNENVRFSGGQLVATRFGPVLVAPGNVARFSHVSPGRIGAFYLRRTATGFARGRDFPGAVIGGSMGSLSEWSVSRRFGPQPVIQAEGGSTGQGLTCSTTTLTALTPRGPVEIAEVPTYYSNRPNGREIKGRIGAIVPGRSFVVTYRGTRNFSETWVRRGQQYTRVGARRFPTC